jgi:hypothetical protein
VRLRPERRLTRLFDRSGLAADERIAPALLAAGVAVEHPHRPRRAFLTVGTGVAVLKDVRDCRVTEPRIAQVLEEFHMADYLVVEGVHPKHDRTQSPESSGSSAGFNPTSWPAFTRKRFRLQEFNTDGE